MMLRKKGEDAFMELCRTFLINASTEQQRASGLCLALLKTRTFSAVGAITGEPAAVRFQWTSRDSGKRFVC